MKALIFLFIILITQISFADEIEAFNAFGRPAAFRSTYIEEKHLPSLSAPLKSEGDFLYIKDRGIAWIMNEPFSMKTVITPHKLIQWVEGEKQHQSTQTHKAIEPILQNISAIFAGDFNSLETQFEIDKINATQISLTPKSNNLKPHLKKIIINGTTTIEKITIINAPDKYTITTFGKASIGMQYITDTERALFDQ